MKRILTLLAACLLSLAATPTITYSQAALQFRLVVNSPTADSEQMTVVQPNNSPSQPEVLNVQKEVLLDQTAVKNAMVEVDPLGNIVMNVKFTDDGAKRLAEVTSKNVGERLAIVINGKLYSAPRINSAITGGAAGITGHFTKQEAKNLAARINGSPVGEDAPPAGEVLTWPRIGFYCFALLFVAALGIVVWIAIRRNGASSAVPPYN